MIKKIKNTALSIDSLKKLLSNRLFKIAARSDIAVRNVKDVPAGKVLVLATHPDDETFSCGGAIIKHVKQADPIKVIFFTDGSRGFPVGFRPSAREKKEMVVTREEEARHAADILGLTDLIFMNYRDGELSANKNNISYLRQLLSEYDPDIVYLPAVNDFNSDHSQTAKMFSGAVAEMVKKIQIFQYEVWSPIVANTVLNVDLEIEDKLKAVKAYKSQEKSRDYYSAIVGLDTYRGAISGASKFAEGYFRSNKEFFLEYYKLDSQ